MARLIMLSAGFCQHCIDKMMTCKKYILPYSTIVFVGPERGELLLWGWEGNCSRLENCFVVRDLGSLVCRNLVAHDADAKTKTTRDSMNVGSCWIIIHCFPSRFRFCIIDWKLPFIRIPCFVVRCLMALDSRKVSAAVPFVFASGLSQQTH